MSLLHHWLVAILDSDWEPSLLALWVLSLSNVKIIINLSKDVSVDSLVVGKIFKEYYLKVAVEGCVVSPGFWGSCAIKLNIIFGNLVGKSGTISMEIELNWRKTWLVDPSIPVNRLEDSIGLSLVEVVLDEVFPVHSNGISSL